MKNDKKLKEKNSSITIAVLIILIVVFGYLWLNEKSIAKQQIETLNKMTKKTKEPKKMPIEEEWKTFHNDKYGYSINIPAIYGTSLLEGAIFNLDEELKKAKNSDRLELVDWTDCEGTISFKVMVSRDLKKLQCSQLENGGYCKIEDTLFQGLNAKRFSCEKKVSQNAEGDFYVYSNKQGICFEKENNAYEVSLNIEEQEVSEEMFFYFDDALGLFSKTLESFKFD